MAAMPSVSQTCGRASAPSSRSGLAPCGAGIVGHAAADQHAGEHRDAAHQHERRAPAQVLAQPRGQRHARERGAGQARHHQADGARAPVGRRQRGRHQRGDAEVGAVRQPGEQPHAGSSRRSPARRRWRSCRRRTAPSAPSAARAAASWRPARPAPARPRPRPARTAVMTWPACGMVTPRSRATSGSRPMITNSPVPIAKLPTPSAHTAGQKWRSRSAASARQAAAGRTDEAEVMAERAGTARIGNGSIDCAAVQQSVPRGGLLGRARNGSACGPSRGMRLAACTVPPPTGARMTDHSTAPWHRPGPDARKAGDRVPDVTFRLRRGADWEETSTRRDLRRPQRDRVLAARRVHADLLVDSPAALRGAGARVRAARHRRDRLRRPSTTRS